MSQRTQNAEIFNKSEKMGFLKFDFVIEDNNYGLRNSRSEG